MNDNNLQITQQGLTYTMALHGLTLFNQIILDTSGPRFTFMYLFIYAPGLYSTCIFGAVSSL